MFNVSGRRRTALKTKVTYFWGNSLVRFLNHCCDGNATMIFMCIVALHVAVNNIKIIFKFAQKSFYGEFYLASNNKIYLDLHVICPKSCPILTSFGVTQKIFIQTSFVEIYGNLSINRADSYRHTEGWTDGRA